MTRLSANKNTQAAEPASAGSEREKQQGESIHNNQEFDDQSEM